MKSGPWSPEDNAELVRLYGLLVPMGEIAQTLDRSLDAVLKRRKRMNLPPHRDFRGRQPTTRLAGEREHVMQLAGRLHTQVEIAEITGLTKWRVRHIITAAEAPDRSMIADDAAFVRKLRADGGMPRYPTHPLNGSIMGGAWCGPDGGHWKGAAAMGRAA